MHNDHWTYHKYGCYGNPSSFLLWEEVVQELHGQLIAHETRLKYRGRQVRADRQAYQEKAVKVNFSLTLLGGKNTAQIMHK